MESGRFVFVLFLIAAAVLGCGTGGPSSPPSPSGEPSTAPSPSRTLHLLIRAEPVSLAAKPLEGTGVSIRSATRPFNATLDINDGREQVRPYLAEALPQVNTDTWRVFPDGRMETTYRLRPNLTWHDGTPLEAEDFAFAWRVYTTPELGLAATKPQSLMEEVVAPDARTVVIRWRQLYADASALTETFQALPRHILESAYLQGTSESFINHPFWNKEYVGLGPYRLERWEPGAFIEGVAFDKHVWGRPRVERLTVRFIPDENAALANLLSGSVHLVSDRSIRFEQGTVLRREWAANNGGVVLLTPTMGRYTHLQFRPELASPAGILDVRVRRALAHGIDKQALNDGLFEGIGVMTASLIRHSVPYYADIDRAVAKYPYDPRRTEQLMTDAGYTRGADGVYVSAAGERFSPQLMNQAGVQPERETTIMVDTWRRLGIDAQPYIVPVARSRDDENRATFPAMQTASGSGVYEAELQFLTSAQIGSPQTRWRGGNRGGWANADFDRGWEGYNTILETTERNRQVVEMERLITEQLPVIPLLFNFAVSAYLTTIQGADAGVVNDVLVTWNIHEWELLPAR